VVDWLVPVGSWLSALTADAGYTFITGGQSVKTEMKFKESRITNVPNGSTKIITSHPPSFFGGRDTFARTCYSGSPVPGLYVKNPFSFEHCANALALLALAFRKR
jgi:hypothetical protein